MDYISALLLFTSVILSVGRNVLSKGISNAEFGTKNFYLAQFLIFAGGSVVLILFGGKIEAAAPLTLFCALIYGVLLVSAQWCYTAALGSGNVSVCSTVYSLGFIFPSLSGALFWNENLTLLNVLGIICVIPAIIISGVKPKSKKTDKNNYIFFLLAAMMSSGGLGIMQKIQQKSVYAVQKEAFVLAAFVFASAVSLMCFVFARKSDNKLLTKNLVMSSCIGVCFALCNLLNTTLAGMLDSAVFFPMQNISVILISMVFGIIVFKEKFNKKEFLVLMFGIMSILLLNS